VFQDGYGGRIECVADIIHLNVFLCVCIVSFRAYLYDSIGGWSRSRCLNMCCTGLHRTLAVILSSSFRPAMAVSPPDACLQGMRPARGTIR